MAAVRQELAKGVANDVRNSCEHHRLCESWSNHRTVAKGGAPTRKAQKKISQSALVEQTHHTQTRAPASTETGMGVRNPEQFSSDFEDFANVINWHLVDYAPWRLQELPTFELSKLAISQPAYGRRYAVFHNQARVGEIELEPDYRYSTETPGVTIHIELNWVRLLPFETVRDFLTHMAVETFGYQRGTVEYFQTNGKLISP